MLNKFLIKFKGLFQQNLKLSVKNSESLMAMTD